MQKVDYVFDRFARTVTNSAFCVTTNWIADTDTLLAIGGLDEIIITEDLAAQSLLIESCSELVSVVDLGWIWYNNIWVLIGIILKSQR